jgi:hypothetical protein
MDSLPAWRMLKGRIQNDKYHFYRNGAYYRWMSEKGFFLIKQAGPVGFVDTFNASTAGWAIIVADSGGFWKNGQLYLPFNASEAHQPDVDSFIGKD